MTADALYRVIEDCCTYGYHLTDNEYGFPLIEREDVSEKGEDLFLISFRLPESKIGYGFNTVVRDVCNRLGSVERTAIVRREEYGIPFYECAWIIWVGDAKAS